MTADAHAMTLALLGSRAPDGTICPSEVARALARDTDWREAMPEVHAAVDRLLEEGAIKLSWKGRPLASRTGPYRLRLAGPQEDLPTSLCPMAAAKADLNAPWDGAG